MPLCLISVYTEQEIVIHRIGQVCVEENMTETVASQENERKPYIKPGITHELELETRAGSPVGIPPLDLLP